MSRGESSGLLASGQSAPATGMAPAPSTGTGAGAAGASNNARADYYIRVWRAVSPQQNLQQMAFRRAGSRSATSLDALDGLRALAYVWVVAYHCNLHKIALTSLPGRLVPAVVGDGDSGVTIFLVLSVGVA